MKPQHVDDDDLSWLFERIPHRGPMLFIDEVVRVGKFTIETRATMKDDFIMAREGVISPLVSIELFAQSAALFMAHRSAQSNLPFVRGALLGTRKLEVTVDAFAVGDILDVHAEEVFGAGALAQFQCVLRRGEDEVASGSINVASGANIVRG